MPLWKLVSSDQRCSVAFEVTDNGALNGALIYENKSYNVGGGWDASYSLPERHFSAFAFFGRTGNSIPDFVAATGIMTGPGTAPTQIDIQVDVSSSNDGTLKHYKGVLVPS